MVISKIIFIHFSLKITKALSLAALFYGKNNRIIEMKRLIDRVAYLKLKLNNNIR